jgi:hypothetical protein
MATVRIKPERGTGHFTIIPISPDSVALSRKGNTIHMTKDDVKNTFKAVYDALFADDTTKEKP